MHAIPPPPNDDLEDSGMRAKSDPPAVKIERGRLDASVDIICAGLLTYLLASGVLVGPVERGAALTGILTIAGVAGLLRTKGQVGGVVLFLIAHGPRYVLATMGAYLIRHGMQFIVMLSIIAGGCGADLAPKIADARDGLNQVGSGMQVAGQALTKAGKATAALCALPALAAQPECSAALAGYDEAAGAFNAAVEAYQAAQTAVDVADVLVSK